MLILSTYILPPNIGEVALYTRYLSTQPRSQSLSSSHPLERERGGKKRDPGNEVVKHRLCVDLVSF